MIVDDIFLSIQGESKSVGLPTVFIRFYGCNVGCKYCDTPQNKGTKMDIDQIMHKVKSLASGAPRVCITGGEPLLQNHLYALIYELVLSGFEVSIETSGCVPIAKDPYSRTFRYVMDIKCPSSEVSRRNVFTNLMILHAIDEVKFVIRDRIDYDYAKEVLNLYPTKAKILFSPMFINKVIACSDLPKWILEDKINARVGVQMHKILDVK